MTELKGIKWPRFFKDLLISEGFREGILQWAASEALRKQGYCIVREDNAVIEYKGSRFILKTPNYYHIFSVYEDYPFELIRPTDTILDLGANIGAFSIPASKLCKKVWAIEPVFGQEFCDNLELNKCSNINLLSAGIGDGKVGRVTYKFADKSSKTWSWSLSELKGVIKESIDYLKMDIEGDEWSINPQEFKGIRVITGEVHLKSGHKWPSWLKWFEENGYSVSIRGSWNKEKRFTAEIKDE